MLRKSVREMNEAERTQNSLAVRVFRVTLKGAAVLGAVALFMGLLLYTTTLVERYISESFNLARGASGVLQTEEDVIPISREVMAIYQSLSEEERALTGTEEYRKRFEDFWIDREDYWHIRSILASFADSSTQIADIYLAMYDRESSAMVYIVDPDEDPETAVKPCDWDPVTRSEMERFLAWDGTGMLYSIENTVNYGWLCTCGTPVWDQNGEIAAFVLCDISLSVIWEGMKEFLVYYVIAMALLIPLIGFLVSRRMKQTVVEPINAIAKAAQKYVEDKRAGINAANHFAGLDIHTGNEVENLSLVMADMERDMAEIEVDLTRITAEKQRISTELELASRIQLAMLPHTFPPFPERPEFDIFASMDPAKEVGGDFYDFFLIDEDHLGLVMADVSGKGVPAALFMMASKIILQSVAMLGSSPGEILTKTNEAICSGNEEEMFVTVWMGILEISTGRLTAANAGHEYPVLKLPGGTYELYKDRHGLVLGGMEGVRYREYELQLEPGTKLFIYTDGVPEATNSREELFGIKRMVAALNIEPDAEPKEILKTVRKEVNSFVKEAEQFEDLTMMCIEYKGPAAKNGR